MVLHNLKSKLKSIGGFWIAAAALQAFIGLINLIIGIALQFSPDFWVRQEGIPNLVMGVFLLAFMTVNLVLGISHLKLAKRIALAPIEAVHKFESLGKRVGLLVYAILCGGVFGLVVGIMGLTTRTYVMDNRGAFEALESRKG